MHKTLAVLLAMVWAAAAHASCGSSSCPLDLNALDHLESGFSLDLSWQSIDQNQPRIGTHTAFVGEIRAPEHDEIRTTNRLTTLTLRYAASPRWQFSASLPWVDRTHLHFAHDAAALAGGGDGELESWTIRGIGDLTLQARRRLFDFEGHRDLWALAAIKLPTGAHDHTNGEERAEVPLQPGTGSVDAIAGLAFESGFTAPTTVHGPLGSSAWIPLFASVTWRRNGSGAEHYRVGSEWQANAGTAWPITHSLVVLAQLNGRVRGKDRNPELDGALDPFTGGSALFVSPGLRWSFGRAAFYGVVQIPIVQNVHEIQLTAKKQFVAGIQSRL